MSDGCTRYTLPVIQLPILSQLDNILNESMATLFTANDSGIGPV